MRAIRLCLRHFLSPAYQGTIIVLIGVSRYNWGAGGGIEGAGVRYYINGKLDDCFIIY